MSKATWTFGRFNPPTESGHGKLVHAVQSHAEESGGEHYIFPTHSQDPKKNPMSHADKVSSMKKLFPGANVVSHKHVRTAIDALKHLEKKGVTHPTMVVGSDRVGEFHKLLNKYNGKEYNFKKIDVKSAGHRDPDAEGSEGMSASKLRGLVKSGKKDEFVSHYSDPKIGKSIHDKVKKGMQTESIIPVCIFLLGGPGSGKDYVLKNVFSKFDLTEVQIEQVLAGNIRNLIEAKKNIVVNGSSDSVEKIEEAKAILQGYSFDQVLVSVTNQVSRNRNLTRDRPLAESVRISKWLKVEQLADFVEDVFVFNNTINLAESAEIEQLMFASQIENLLARVIDNGLEIKESAPTRTIKLKSFKKVASCTKESIDDLFDESFDIGTDAYLQHALQTTPGQGAIKNVQKAISVDTKQTSCTSGSGGGTCSCGACSLERYRRSSGTVGKGQSVANEAKESRQEEKGTIDTKPTLKSKPIKKGKLKAGAQEYNSQVGAGGGSNVFGGLMPQIAVESRKSFSDFLKNK
jgi:hypothetical protein